VDRLRADRIDVGSGTFPDHAIPALGSTLVMYGMDAGELSRRSNELDRLARPLADEMFAAIDEQAPVQVRQDLIKRAKACIASHDQFLGMLRGVQREEVEGEHKRVMDRIRRSLQKLEGLG
jgi:hypothetical protein